MTDTKTEVISINGHDYVRKDSIPQNVSPPLGPIQIIVGDKGFVFVGNIEDHADGSVTITNCRNIRQWGTTKGLGELVTGPTGNTKVDNWGTVKLTPILRLAVTRGW
jgi:hypothetical protein